MGKKWYQSRTLWTNVTAVVGAGSTYAMTNDPAPLAAAGAAAVMGFINILLRLITKQPLE